MIGGRCSLLAAPALRQADCRRFYSAVARTLPSFAFDIDGVLKQGSHVLPEAKEALRIVQEKQCPFMCA